MEYEKKITLTVSELRHLIMESWISGWYINSENQNDSGKILYAAERINELLNSI